MIFFEVIFTAGLLTVLYTYFGYGTIIFVINKFSFFKKQIPKPTNVVPNKRVKYEQNFPLVSLIISASGESREVISQKISNTLKLNYPKDKLEVFFAVAYDTDSETDETIEAYTDKFLEDPEIPGVSSSDEELYMKFEEFDNADNPCESELLTKLEKLLSVGNANSSALTIGGKKMIDQYKLGKEENDDLTIFITKDIIRKGKISQVNRTIKKATGDIILFSDANCMFNEDAVINIVKHFKNNQVGCVAGEKRIKKDPETTSEGEGIYWKYESFLKRNDSELWSAVGAAGEIFAVRRELLPEGVNENAIIEDFILSMEIAKSGYRIVYEPDAYAEEDPTTDIKSEYIRRRRIAAGGFQAIVWLKELLNIRKFRVLAFQYISHRVLRWAVVPFLLPLLLVINIILAINSSYFFSLLLAFQIIFYIFTLIGLILEKRRVKIRIFNLPLYFSMMNFAALVGFKRFLLGNQSVVWERIKR